MTQFVGRNQNTAMTMSSRVSNTELPYLTMNDETGRFFARSFTQTMSINKRAGLNNLMTLYMNYLNLNLIPDFISVNKYNRISYNTLSGGYQTEVNSIDRKYFPDKGILFQASVNTSKLVSGVLKPTSQSLHTSQIRKGLSVSKEPGPLRQTTGISFSHQAKYHFPMEAISFFPIHPTQ